MAAQLPHASAGQVAVQTPWVEREVDGHAIVAWGDRDLSDVGADLDDSLGQRKTNGKIFQIVRRRHHHGMSKSVITKCDRGLLRNTDQSALIDTPGLADRIHGDRNQADLRIVLKRLVHCAVRSCFFKAWKRQSFPRPTARMRARLLCAVADTAPMELNGEKALVESRLPAF